MAAFPLDREREEIIDFLTDCFAKDILTTEEYEQRVEQAHAAQSLPALQEVVSDIRKSPGSQTTPAYNGNTSVANSSNPQRLVAVLGEQHISGKWLKKEGVIIQAFMGTVRCDLRDVQLFPRTTIQIYSFMAEVKLIVPPGISLVSNVAPILAEIRRKDRSPELMPGAPVVEISGVAIMSSVTIKT